MAITLHTQTSIHAPAAVVWKHLVHFSVYPEWNPFIQPISGEPVVGSTLQATINGTRFSPVVLAAMPEKELRWKGKLWLGGLFDGEHVFELHPQADGSTLFIQSETFSGLLVSFMRKMIHGKVKAGFNAMNTALKVRCEQETT